MSLMCSLFGHWFINRGPLMGPAILVCQSCGKVVRTESPPPKKAA